MSDDPLNLRALPLQEPPADLWNVIEARLDVSAAQNKGGPAALHETAAAVTQPRWLPMAMAAAISVFTIGLVVILANSPELQPLQQPGLADSSEPATAVATTDNNSPSAELQLAQQASALLEARLSQVSNGVVEADQLNMLLLLESELGWVDELLTARPADVELWKQRVSLLDQMNQRYASNDLETQFANLIF